MQRKVQRRIGIMRRKKRKQKKRKKPETSDSFEDTEPLSSESGTDYDSSGSESSIIIQDSDTSEESSKESKVVKHKKLFKKK